MQADQQKIQQVCMMAQSVGWITVLQKQGPQASVSTFVRVPRNHKSDLATGGIRQEICFKHLLEPSLE